MSRVEIILLGNGDTEITHLESGARVRSSKSPMYGGTGEFLSSTDLLAAALGSCIATNIEPVAERHGVALGRIRTRVTKTLSQEVKRLDALDVEVMISGDVPSDVLLRFERAASHCLVHQSLAEHVAVNVSVSASQSGVRA